LGYSVVASTGKRQEADYLRQLGAIDIIARDELSVSGKPLQRERWAGTVDTLGSHTLANACAATRWNGAVAACGLAQGGDFTSSVMPFILRGVTLYGINCVFVDNATRARAYDLLAVHVLGSKLDEMTSEIGLSEVITASQEMIDGRRKGRTVIAVDR
jgi:acrylyl-CoA reductase (NADPH)